MRRAASCRLPRAATGLTSHESRVTRHDRSAAALQLAHWCAILALIALTFLCLLWEAALAPIRPVGSVLMLKALPLLAPLFGLLRGNVMAYKWTLLLALPYFAEGIVRAWSDAGVSSQIALIEIALALALFVACACYVRLPRPLAEDAPCA
jgi:uncharacterized membrane protein